jgi:hypothetical protein
MHLRTTRALARALVLGGLTFGLTACDVSVDGNGGFSLDVASGKAQDEWSRSYEIEPGGQLEIINVNGRITAEAGDGPVTEVRAERTARATSDEAARELLGQLDMREETSSSRVRVEVRAPRMSGRGGHELRWTIKVPKGVNVDLRTVNGGVRLTGLHGEIRARSTNGGVTGKNLTASSLDASVTNGGMEIELASLPSTGTFDMKTVNGGVTLTLPGDARADVTARCTNGGISVSGLELQLEGEQSRRRVSGKLNGGGARVTVETTNGGVRVSKSST